MTDRPARDIILIFRGTHQVLLAEKRLKEGGVAMRLIPVPRRLTSDCGLAVRIAPVERDKAREVLARSSLPPASVHVALGDDDFVEEPL